MSLLPTGQCSCLTSDAGVAHAALHLVSASVDDSCFSSSDVIVVWTSPLHDRLPYAAGSHNKLPRDNLSRTSCEYQQ